VTARPKKPAFWFKDFRFRGGRVQVLDTGADIKFNRTLVGESLSWFWHHLFVRARLVWLTVSGQRTLKVWFEPDVPRPWYLLWMAMAWGGLRIAKSTSEADAAVYFIDQTWGPILEPPVAHSFNYGCPDVSKSHVAKVFEAVFGYPLAIDPRTWSGPAVEKGEINGAHDGRVINCPALPRPGKCYQRLVDTSDGAFAYDLRTHCVGGEPIAVWIKKKRNGESFAIQNLGVHLVSPQSVYSAAELVQIRAFVRAMAVDWAGLDVLREKDSGRLYIVDVNKTDVGPIVSLSLADKLKTSAILARALNKLVRAAPISSRAESDLPAAACL
jgi:hypothetical protein